MKRRDATSADSVHQQLEDAIARSVAIAARGRGRLRVKDQSGHVIAEHDYRTAS